MYGASLSYGKDSIAMIEAIKLLDYPLDFIVTADIWATKDINANYPEVYEFKKYADKIIKKRYGIEVTHVSSDISFNDGFYHINTKGKYVGRIRGFPMIKGNWCLRDIKLKALNKCFKKEDIRYIGIASNEIKRINRHKNISVMPLVDIKWDENYCFEWCKNNNLLSPSYNISFRDGCWFCHNQGIEQLRNLKFRYPELWNLMLKWDTDSPVPFHPGHSIHDYDKRFEMEKYNRIPDGKKFKWNMIKEDVISNQLTIYDYI